MRKPKPSMTDSELAKRLTGALMALREELGWDGADCKTTKRAGWVLIRHVLSQGYYELQTGPAEAYLNWLEAGNKGSYLRFRNSAKPIKV